jgi:hypothetical protein
MERKSSPDRRDRRIHHGRSDSGMEKISRKDIRDLSAYEKVREEARQRTIALKKRRRVFLGNDVTLVFENRDTVISQIQEMMRVEHIYDEAKILHEIETYNELIPDDGEVSGTLFIEIVEQDGIQEVLERFQGLDDGRSLYLRIGDRRIHALFEKGRSREDKISAVHYVRFLVVPVLASGEDLAKTLEREPIRLCISHPQYQAEALLGPEVREEILKDLRTSVIPS